MSIIYDALNKAEKKNIDKKQNLKPKKQFAIIGAALVVIVLIFAFVLLRTKVHSSPKSLPEKGADTKPVKFIEKKYASGRLVLEGIIYDKGVPTAIINGKVLKEGDKISGLKVTKISKDSVQLFDFKDDREMTLSFQ